MKVGGGGGEPGINVHVISWHNTFVLTNVTHVKTVNCSIFSLVVWYPMIIGTL